MGEIITCDPILFIPVGGFLSPPISIGIKQITDSPASRYHSLLFRFDFSNSDFEFCKETLLDARITKYLSQSNRIVNYVLKIILEGKDYQISVSNKVKIVKKLREEKQYLERFIQEYSIQAELMEIATKEIEVQRKKNKLPRDLDILLLVAKERKTKKDLENIKNSFQWIIDLLKEDTKVYREVSDLD